jgi:hypothetical protein
LGRVHCATGRYALFPRATCRYNRCCRTTGQLHDRHHDQGRSEALSTVIASHSYLHAHAFPHTYANPHAYFDAHSNTYSYSDIQSFSYHTFSHSDRCCHPHADPHAHTHRVSCRADVHLYAYFDPYRNEGSYDYTNTLSNGISHAHTHTDHYSDGDFHACTHGDIYDRASHGHVYVHAYADLHLDALRWLAATIERWPLGS